MSMIIIYISQSCIESIGLTTLATATAYSFYDTDQTAGLLYLPYVGGLFYLSIENFLAYKKEIEAAFLKTPDTPQITAIQRKVV